MAKRKLKTKPPMQLNLTSMMDVSFQLIIFFILISNFAAADLPKLAVPEPTESKAQDPEGIERVLINVVPLGATGEARHMVVYGKKIERDDFAGVTTLLTEAKSKNDEIEVFIRADGVLYFEHVQPIMKAVTDAHISNVNLMAIRDKH